MALKFVAKWLFPTCVLASATIGCGSRSRPQPVGPEPMPVQGKVFYQGKPAAGFRVMFHPLFDLGAIKFAPFGISDQDGAFRLRSYAANDGAPVGEYAVTFDWPERPPAKDQINDPDVPDIDRLQGKYSSAEQSRWKVNVQQGVNELEPFQLD